MENNGSALVNEYDRIITVWRFRSVDGKQVVESIRASQPDDPRYQHEYQQIIYRGSEIAYKKQFKLAGT